jgi:excisionase family DNA binding protein
VEEQVLTLKELRSILKLSEKTVLRLLNGGEIKGKKVAGKWRVLRSEVFKYLLDFDND